MTRLLRFPLAALVTIAGLWASEHRGVVKFGPVPVPGATVTATQGDQKLVVVTDDQGVYAFPNLADGIWKIRVEMLTFEPIEREVGIVPNAPSPEWDLKLLPLAEIKADKAAPTPATASAGAPAGANGAAPS
ncbi:MAG TPA: carboxypeptidase-like regulatory domain-containing protein, partial [Bryobacteraceae bacterium]